MRKVKGATECLESGELDDFKQDLEYILTSLNDADVSSNIKCLRFANRVHNK